MTHRFPRRFASRPRVGVAVTVVLALSLVTLATVGPVAVAGSATPGVSTAPAGTDDPPMARSFQRPPDASDAPASSDAPGDGSEPTAGAEPTDPAQPTPGPSDAPTAEPTPPTAEPTPPGETPAPPTETPTTPPTQAPSPAPTDPGTVTPTPPVETPVPPTATPRRPRPPRPTDTPAAPEPTPALPLPTATRPGEVRYEDAFDAPESGLLGQTPRDQTDTRGYYDDGEYVLAIAAPDVAPDLVAPIRGPGFIDVTISARARLEGDTEGRYITAICREINGLGGYRVYLSPDDGYFAITRFVPGDIPQILQDGFHEDLEQGTGTIAFAFTCSNHLLELRVGDEVVGMAADNAFVVGTVSIGIGYFADVEQGPVEARFDSLTITGLPDGR